MDGERNFDNLDAGRSHEKRCMPIGEIELGRYVDIGEEIVKIVVLLRQAEKSIY